MNSKAYKVRVHVLSPLHIGCDDAYEPTGFVVDRENRKIISFDPVDFVRALSPVDRQKFLAICEKGTLGSLIELYQFMDGRQSAASGRSVTVTEGFLAGYDRVKRLSPHREQDIRQELNKFLIARTSYLPMDQSPYIPGSALKGALRTGWLNHLNRGTLHDRPKPKDLETGLLGGTFAADPFRMVKVSDLLPVGQPETMIRFAVNKKKKSSQHEPRGPQQILEVIRHDQEAVFEGIITIIAPEKGATISRPVPNGSEFFAMATSFFQKEMTDEEEMLRGISLPAGIVSRLRGSFGDRFMKSVFPVRLGRHSGAESVTIAGARSIKILGKKGDPPKFGPAALTTWLAGDSPKATSNLLPFGWIALEVLDADPTALYPVRTVAERRPAELGDAAKPLPPTTPSFVAETIVWEVATLTWTPGNATLTAVSEGKRAEAKLAGDRSIVPAALHKKLFEKKDAVRARITVEKLGNAYRIVTIEV